MLPEITPIIDPSPETIDQMIVSADGLLSDALQTIDGNAQGIAFAVDAAGKIVGVISDGDIRRNILKGATTYSRIRDVMNPDFVSLSVDSSADDIFAFLKGPIRVIPLLDESGRPVDFASAFRHHRIPVLEPSLAGKERTYVNECLETSWVSSKAFLVTLKLLLMLYGGRLCRIDLQWHKRPSQPLAALGVGPGDEVIVPDQAFCIGGCRLPCGRNAGSGGCGP